MGGWTKANPHPDDRYWHMEEPLVGRWIVESEQVASKVYPGGIDLRVCWASSLNLVTVGGWTKADALFKWLDTGTWKSRLLDDGA